jgi:hypothetical protein
MAVGSIMEGSKPQGVLMFFLTRSRQKRAVEESCGVCEHFNNEPLMLEELFSGINILSSVHGCSRGDAGICRLHDRYLLPSHCCRDFSKKEPVDAGSGE